MPSQVRQTEAIWLTAVEIGERYRNGTLTPQEMVAASFARIEQVDPGLNAFCALDRERAQFDARASHERFGAGACLGLLDGVPVAIKDMTPTKGLRTAMGSRLYVDHTPDSDAIIVERLRAAGAIIVGKTTTSEFANASVTDSPLTGSTRNPWDPSRTSGGSSGGSAVAVATGCVPLAEGSDMGGSVRIPACFCGVVGLKPSLGRIPLAWLPNRFDPTAHHGPIARSVADAELFLRATMGPDLRDPLSLPEAPDLLNASNGSIAGKRIAFSPDFGFMSVEPVVVANALEMARKLEQNGATIETIDLELTPAIYEFGYKLFAALMVSYYGPLESEHWDMLDPTVLKFFQLGRNLSANTLFSAQIEVSRQWEKIAKIFLHYDGLICPTMPRAAPPLGRSEFDYTGQDAEGKSVMFDMTFPFNIFGSLPALSLPSGFDADGLPTGLQIVGRPHDEAFVFALAHKLHDHHALTKRLQTLGPWPPVHHQGARA